MRRQGDRKSFPRQFILLESTPERKGGPVLIYWLAFDKNTISRQKGFSSSTPNSTGFTQKPSQATRLLEFL
jgi:hypothetical protein